MKIAIFDGSFQTTTFIQRLISGLVNSGVEVYVLGFNEKLIHPVQSVNYIALGSNQSFLALIKTSLLLGFSASLQKGFLAIKNILTKERKKLQQQNLSIVLQQIQPDIVHLQWSSLLGWMQPFVKQCNFKIILSERGYHVNVKPFVDAQNLSFLREYYPYIDGFHSVSKAITEESNKIYQHPKKLVNVIYTGLCLGDFNFQPTLPQNKPLQILSVGRHHWVKGYDIALRAMHQLKLRNIQFKYQIIGVQNNEELLFLRDDLGLYNEVDFLGKQSHQEVIESMTQADILLLPSIQEGIANVAVEAMALGTPVISTNCGGMQELITHEKEGWIVPIRSPEAMANQIELFTMLNEDELKTIQLAARKKVKIQHSEDKMIEDMISLYQMVQ